MLAAQWLFGADKDRHAGTAELCRVERITCGLLNLDISGNGGDGDDADVWSAQGHDQRDRVIGGNIGVDQEGARHSRSITNRGTKLIRPDARLLRKISRSLDFEVYGLFNAKYECARVFHSPLYIGNGEV